MRTIKIKVPNKSFDKEWEVVDAVEHLLNKMTKDLDINIHQGVGGNLDDWKEPDFKYPDGLLMLFRVSLKPKDKLKKVDKILKRVERQYNEAKRDSNSMVILFAEHDLKIAKELLANA